MYETMNCWFDTNLFFCVREVKEYCSSRGLLLRFWRRWKVTVDFDRSARPARKKAIDGVVQISARPNVIEKPITIHLFVLGHEGETSSIRLMNRSLYRLTPVKTYWLRISSNLSTGANRPPT